MNDRQIDEPVVIAEIMTERARQIEKEGWSEEHDHDHDLGELSMAAAAYASVASAQARGASVDDFPADMIAVMMMSEGDWPWDPSWWKPKDQRRNLVRAAALIVAEIERMDRAAAPRPETRKADEDDALDPQALAERGFAKPEGAA